VTLGRHTHFPPKKPGLEGWFWIGKRRLQGHKSGAGMMWFQEGDRVLKELEPAPGLEPETC
jgi:hypothetical protein